MATYACYLLALISLTINFLHSFEHELRKTDKLYGEQTTSSSSTSLPKTCAILTMQIQKACTHERILRKYFKLIYKNKKIANLYINP